MVEKDGRKNGDKVEHFSHRFGLGRCGLFNARLRAGANSDGPRHVRVREVNCARFSHPRRARLPARHARGNGLRAFLG
jgi:hypothetical protein